MAREDGYDLLAFLEVEEWVDFNNEVLPLSWKVPALLVNFDEAVLDRYLRDSSASVGTGGVNRITGFFDVEL